MPQLYEKGERVKNIIEKLQQLNIGPDDYVYLNYVDRADVWHISDDYVEEALGETSTASKLAGLLSRPGVRVYSRYEEDILELMRDNDLLEDYDREGWFEKYLTETLITQAYEYDLLTVSTERHDHKRGTCEISANVKVRAEDIYHLGDEANAFVQDFDVVVQTENGVLLVAV